MTTPQPQQEYLQVPELTPEQEARLCAKFFYLAGYILSADANTLNELAKVAAHLATELEIQRREYFDKINPLIKSYENALEHDYCNFGEYEGNSPQEIINILIALLQKETI